MISVLFIYFLTPSLWIVQLVWACYHATLYSLDNYYKCECEAALVTEHTLILWPRLTCDCFTFYQLVYYWFLVSLSFSAFTLTVSSVVMGQLQVDLRWKYCSHDVSCWMGFPRWREISFQEKAVLDELQEGSWWETMQHLIIQLFPESQIIFTNPWELSLRRTFKSPHVESSFS